MLARPFRLFLMACRSIFCTSTPIFAIAAESRGRRRGRGRDGRARSARGLVGWVVRPEAPVGGGRGRTSSVVHDHGQLDHGKRCGSKGLCCFVSLVAGLGVTVPAYAIGIDEKQVSISLGETLGGGRGTSRAGLQAGVEAAIGLSDSWAARGGASFAWQPKQAYTGSTQISALFLGATYSLDVVRWVPFLDLGISLADWRGNGFSLQSLGPQAGLGVELLLSRRWTLATLARLDYLVLRLSGPGGAHPWLGWVGLRLGRVF